MSPEVEPHDAVDNADSEPDSLIVRIVTRTPAQQPPESAMTHADDDIADDHESATTTPGLVGKTLGLVVVALAWVGSIRLPSLGSERHEMMLDTPRSATTETHPVDPAHDPAQPQAQSQAQAPPQRSPSRFPLLGLKNEARVGIAALLSFVLLVVALMYNRGMLGGKSLTMALHTPTDGEKTADPAKDKDKDKEPKPASKSSATKPPTTPAPIGSTDPSPAALLAFPPDTTSPPIPPAGSTASPSATPVLPTTPSDPLPLLGDPSTTSNEQPVLPGDVKRPKPAIKPASEPVAPPVAAAPTPAPAPAKVDPESIPLLADEKLEPGPPTLPVVAATPAPPQAPAPVSASASAPPQQPPPAPPTTESAGPPSLSPPPMTEPPGLPAITPEPVSSPPPQPAAPPSPTPAPAQPRFEPSAPVRAERPPTLESVPAAASNATMDVVEPTAAALSAGWVVVQSGGRRVVGAAPIVSTPADFSPAPARVIDRPRPNVADEPAVDQLEPVLHRVLPGENFWTISKQFYQSPRFYRALHAANAKQVPVITELYVGTVLRIPPPEALDRTLIDPPTTSNVPVKRTTKRVEPTDDADLAMPARPRLLRPDPEAPRPPRRPSYTVKPYETLRSIARDTLNDPKRDRDIYNLNRDILGDSMSLQAGTTLTLPEDATINRTSSR